MKRARSKALPRKKKRYQEVEALDTTTELLKKPWETPTLTEVETVGDTRVGPDACYKSFVSPESSTIVGAMWTAPGGDTRGSMRVVFKRANSQDAYDYESIPSELFDQFSAAESKGVFFATQIRPHYLGRRHGERT